MTEAVHVGLEEEFIWAGAKGTTFQHTEMGLGDVCGYLICDC